MHSASRRNSAVSGHSGPGRRVPRGFPGCATIGRTSHPDRVEAGVSIHRDPPSPSGGGLPPWSPTLGLGLVLRSRSPSRCTDRHDRQATRRRTSTTSTSAPTRGSPTAWSAPKDSLNSFIVRAGRPRPAASGGLRPRLRACSREATRRALHPLRPPRRDGRTRPTGLGRVHAPPQREILRGTPVTVDDVIFSLEILRDKDGPTTRLLPRSRASTGSASAASASNAGGEGPRAAADPQADAPAEARDRRRHVRQVDRSRRWAPVPT